MYALDAETLSRLTDLRVSGGAQLQVFAAQRPRRATLTRDGRLLILAADHPARMVTGVGDDPLRMGNRADYLGRIVHILEQDCVDGLMGTADIIEEVLAVDLLRCEGGAESFLADKVLVGCMNRGGLAGTVFEMEDAFTGFTAEQMMSLGLDGAKMMFRLEPMEFASGRTIEACSRAIDACVDNDLAVFLEPLPVRFEDGKYVVEKSVEELVKVCGVASGLGKSSWKTWLKIPYSVDYSRVAGATTCPILMLGGPATGHPDALLREFADGLAAGQNVRGALVGRNVLYPGDADPALVAGKLWKLVHGDSAPEN